MRKTKSTSELSRELSQEEKDHSPANLKLVTFASEPLTACLTRRMTASWRLFECTVSERFFSSGATAKRGPRSRGERTTTTHSCTTGSVLGVLAPLPLPLALAFPFLPPPCC